jgi:hypothetical protein
VLDLGADPQYDAVAAYDYDGSGVTGTNREEFTGLTGLTVTVQVAAGTSTVYSIDTHAYRNADGSFTT